MNARQAHVLPPTLMTELTMHLRHSGSKLSVMQAACAAIHAWIAADTMRQQALAEGLVSGAGPAAPSNENAAGRGYQWKTLFLPHGTELRMSTRESTYHARVCGDQILFNGRSVSPRGLTLAICGEGRNAWRDLWLKLPAERYWKSASRCRREQAQQQGQEHRGEPQPTIAADPAHSLAAATITMSEALQTMLALMERVSARPTYDEERRITRPRREADILAGDCAFD